MPPLPQSVIDKIKNSEFVNFDLLLPNRSLLQSDEYTFKVIGGDTPSDALVLNNQKKPKVTDFSSWMVAWNNFVRCYTIFHPHRLHELLRYQSTICDFVSQYNFAAWSQYDRMFRYQMAYNHGLSWHRIDDDLYNRYVRGATLLNLCYLCRSFGHFASACPNRLVLLLLRVLRPFVPPSSHVVTHSQKGQNFLLLEHVNFLTEDSAQTTNVASHIDVDCVKDPIPPAGVPRAHQTLEHCPLPTTVVSCVNVNLFESDLYDHPIQALVRYVCSGFRDGFNIGFTGVFSPTRPRNFLCPR